ncbi:flagellar basal body protein FliL [Thioclava sp. SK-1]|uniref:flagellar basal body-associated FliL family protein n=1 Tax=Thioclava sp. SK-1 TaxID=1889770 RepID=UPI0008243435|nr:flagellar basal body-associated FliL family protein [Thioclava sp. SK-1]OCX65738.1 flagellar basal body protein FliL [Thioclava sp. SK-1]
MADVTADEMTNDDEPKKKSKLPLIIGLVLMLVGGGGSFFAVYSGMILGADTEATSEPEEPPMPGVPDIAYVPLDPMVISLPNSSARHLRFTAQLEVPAQYQADVELLRPRVLDVLNGYLRAVGSQQLEDPTALITMRAQMLRRIQVVTGEGRVNDLLIIEFVLN